MVVQTHILRQYFDPPATATAETFTATLAQFLFHALALFVRHGAPFLTQAGTHFTARAVIGTAPTAPGRTMMATAAALVEAAEEDAAEHQQAHGLPPGELLPACKARHDLVPQQHHHRAQRGDRREHEYRDEEAELVPLHVPVVIALAGLGPGEGGLVVLRVHLSA